MNFFTTVGTVEETIVALTIVALTIVVPTMQIIAVQTGRAAKRTGSASPSWHYSATLFVVPVLLASGMLAHPTLVVLHPPAVVGAVAVVAVAVAVAVRVLLLLHTHLRTLPRGAPWALVVSSATLPVVLARGTISVATDIDSRTTRGEAPPSSAVDRHRHTDVARPPSLEAGPPLHPPPHRRRRAERGHRLDLAAQE